MSTFMEKAEINNFQNLSPVHKGAVKGSRNTWIHCDICQFFSVKLAPPGRGSEEGTSPSRGFLELSNLVEIKCLQKVSL